MCLLFYNFYYRLCATCGGTHLKKHALAAAGFGVFTNVLLKIQFLSTLKTEALRPFETWANIYLYNVLCSVNTQLYTSTVILYIHLCHIMP